VFRFRFSTATNSPSALQSCDSTSASGYSSSRGSADGRQQVLGSRTSSRICSTNAGDGVEGQLCEPTVAFSNASAMDSVVVEGPEAEDDNEYESSILQSHASPVLRPTVAAVVTQPHGQPSGAKHLSPDHHHCYSRGQDMSASCTGRARMDIVMMTNMTSTASSSL